MCATQSAWGAIHGSYAAGTRNTPHHYKDINGQQLQPPYYQGHGNVVSFATKRA